MNMKKKIFIIFLLIFTVGFININKVHAASSLSITCEDNTIEVGETTSCMVIGTVEKTYSGITAALGSNSYLQINQDSLRNLTDLPGDTHIYYIGEEVFPAGNIEITSFTVTGLSSGSGSLFLRQRTDEEPLGYWRYTETGTEPIIVPPFNYGITVTGGSDPGTLSGDSLLTNLVPNTGELTPAFDSYTFLYSMSVDFTRAGRITFNATKSNVYASVGNTSCDIPNSTSIESITCNIVVTAQDQTTSTYSVTINNSAYVEPIVTNDIFLETLDYDIGGALIPDFKRDVFEYEMHINFSNYTEINFTTTESEDGITVRGKKCLIPSNPNVESVTCNIKLSKNDKSANYKIVLINTNRPDIKCDLVIKSNIYIIDQTNKVIRVNSEHSLDTIKANLYSSCGEIQVFNDKVIITDGNNIVEYKLEKLKMPQTGNKKFLYFLACGSVLVIIGVFMFSKNYFFKKEELK